MNRLELKKFMSYFIVGGISAIIEWVTFYFSDKIFHFSVATIIAFLIATFANYILGKKMTFKDYKNQKNEVFSIYLVSAIGLVLNLVFMKIFVDYMHILEIISKIGATGLVFFWNYFSRRLFIYNDKKDNIKTKIKEKLNSNNKVIKIIISIFIYAGLIFQDILPVYNILSILLFFLILYFIFNYTKKITLKKEKVILNIISIIFTMILLINMIAKVSVNIITPLSLKEIFKIIVSLIGNWFIIKYFLISIYDYLKNKDIFFKKIKISNKKIFIISFITMFLVWLIYLLTYYPGTLSSDSLIQLNMAVNNVPLSDHHPILHTLFIKFFFLIGKSIFNNINAGICLVSLAQMLISCTAFSSFIVFLNKRKVNICILIGILIYYSLSPIFGFYAITMWKDVLFGVIFLGLLMILIKLLESKKITWKQLIILMIITLLFLFFRNNALYIYIFTIPFMIYVYKSNRKKIILNIIIVLSIFLVVKGPIFKSLNITKSSSAESIAIPLQQISRMITYDVELTSHEEKLINDLIPIEIIKEKYIPYSVDGIKFDENFNIEVFDEKKSEYFKLWLGLIFKNPKIAIESYLLSTVGYWNPNFENWSVYNQIDDNDLGVYMDSKLPTIFTKFLNNVSSKSIPILGMQWSIGLCFWIILFFAGFTYLKGNKKYLFIFIPIFGLWLTMMMASPVYGEFRYVYSAYTTLPLYLLLPYFKEKSENK